MPSTAKNPMDVFNLGCEPSAPELLSGEKLFARMSLQMSRKAAQTPVFLVNPDQMDVLSPPSRRRGLDPERVREWAKRQNEDNDDPLRGLEDLYTDWPVIFVAAGLYLSERPTPDEISSVLAQGNPTANAAEALNSLKGPSIYLCCERIAKWASKADVEFKLAMAKVLYHELGHAIMDTGPHAYAGNWTRIIEESLANWLAVGCFKGSERVAAQRLIRRQPAEYLGYVAVDEELISSESLAHRLGRRMPYLGRFDVYFHELRWLLRHGMVLPWPLPTLAGRWNQRLWMASKQKGLLSHPDVQLDWQWLAEHWLTEGSK